MKIVGFSFSKIHVEKALGDFKDIKINNSIDISSIEKVNNEILNKKEDLITVAFKFSIKYEENVAKIEFEGTTLLAMEPKEAKRLLDEWKNKKLSDDFKVPIFNVILRKSNIRALTLEDEMNLPPHVNLPSLKKE
jgi:hypothetical protein